MGSQSRGDAESTWVERRGPRFARIRRTAKVLMRRSGAARVGDVRAWLDALADRAAGPNPTSPFQPALWGRSMGAAIALRTAAEDHRIAALVLESPMVDLDASVAALLRSRRLPFARHLARLITRRAGRLAGVSAEPASPTRAGPARRVCDPDRPRDHRHARPDLRSSPLGRCARLTAPMVRRPRRGAYQRHRRRRRRAHRPHRGVSGRGNEQWTRRYPKASELDGFQFGATMRLTTNQERVP